VIPDNAWQAKALRRNKALKGETKYGRTIRRNIRGRSRILRNKLTAAVDELIKFAARTTCLSQFDHMDGMLTKEPLSQQYHQFPDGTRVIQKPPPIRHVHHLLQTGAPCTQFSRD
jgi:hypothetical protein